jgi:diguanylate cyclase (GGDEF)-like protein
VASAAVALGYKIPIDIVVTGYDDTQEATQILPALTTIRQPTIEFATHAAALLLERIHRGKSDDSVNTRQSPSLVKINGELVVRGSSLSRDLQGLDTRQLTANSFYRCVREAMTGLPTPSSVDLKALCQIMWESMTTGLDSSTVSIEKMIQDSLSYASVHWWSNLCYQVEKISEQIADQGDAITDEKQSAILAAIAKVREQIWSVNMEHEFSVRREQTIRLNMQSEMSSCTRLEEILETMDRWLAVVRPKRCFLIKHSEPTAAPTDGLLSDLILYSQQGVPQVCDYDPFYARNLLPVELEKELDIGRLVLSPIIAGEEQFGYILVDPEEVGELRLDHAVLCIGSAMRNHFLINRLELNAKHLQFANNELFQLANYDELTGLPNRLQFLQKLKTMCEMASSENDAIALLFIDLDGFKYVNDSKGHASGDELLKLVAQRLSSVLPASSHGSPLTARLGGDEFTVVLPLGGEDNVLDNQYKPVCDAILDNLSKPYTLSTGIVNISASIGVAVYPDDGIDSDTLIKHADIAMYRAKDKGKNCMAVYSAATMETNTNYLNLDQKMRVALSAGDFRCVYQPRIDLGSGKVVGMEALLRWIDPNTQDQMYVDTSEVIAVAASTGFVTKLDSFALDESCRQASVWAAEGMPVQVSVNVSVKQLQRDDFVAIVIETLKRHDLAPHLLDLEISETAIMDDVKINAQKLTVLKDLGVDISIDDFGTGYSSLSYLKRLPISSLKIDQSFFDEVVSSDGGNSVDAAIVRTIVSLGTSLNLNLIAEGIENKTQHSFVDMLGCDQAQGNYYYNPQAASQATRTLLKSLIQSAA